MGMGDVNMSLQHFSPQSPHVSTLIAAEAPQLDVDSAQQLHTPHGREFMFFMGVHDGTADL